MLPIAQADKMHYYVLDTGFLAAIPEKSQWAIEGVRRIADPYSKMIVPISVRYEFEHFMKRNERPTTLEDFMKTELKQETFEPYTSKVRKAFAIKMKEEIKELGLEHKMLTYTDQQVIQSAYEIASSNNKVTILTQDEAIYEEAKNQWTKSGLKIDTLSPWNTPDLRLNGFLITDNIIDQISTLDKSTSSYDHYLAIMQDAKFGNSKVNIGCAWFIDRKYRLSLPRINGVKFLKMNFIPENMTRREQVNAFNLLMDGRALGPIGFYNPYDRTDKVMFFKQQMKLYKFRIKECRSEEEAIQMAKRVVEEETLDWSRASTIDFNRHASATGAQIQHLQSEIKKIS